MYEQLSRLIKRLGTLSDDGRLHGRADGDQPSLETRAGTMMDKNVVLKALLDDLRRMNLYDSEQALKNHETMAMTNNELLVHYLVVLRRYLDYLMGKNNYARGRFQILWNDSLLRRMPVEHMMIVHWYFLKHVPKDIDIMPDLVVAFLTHPELISADYRRKYYEFYYRQVDQVVSRLPGDSRHHYRAYAKGQFHDTWRSTYKLPEGLLENIKEDSADGADIMLTLMGETWNARIFGEALDRKALKIIRHFARILTPDDKKFSAYDCIIHVLSNAHDYNYDCDFAISVLKIFEEEHPGILQNYHDDYGNNLLKFLGKGSSSSWGLRENIQCIQRTHPKLLDYLIGAGCDPDEKNTLFLSFNDFAK